MEKPLSPRLQLLESQNQYPDCVCLELEAIARESDSSEKVDLYLTIAFGEQWQVLAGGRVRFGIKGGELRLKLSNCLFTPADIQGQIEDLEISFSPQLLSWTFRNQQNRVLQGSISKLHLGSLQISDLPLLEATFELSSADIYLTDAEGLWTHSLSPNKHAILDRKIALFLQKQYFSPCLSWIQLGQPDRVWTSISERITEENDAENSEALLKLIDTIATATQDNFLELASIAGLNSATDFAGGNLLGVDLNGLDLSNSNLQGVNLRGANLTDTDLSEANLSKARLSGADLSGAYLEAANLTETDLHAASLALANLIAANLSGADLRGVNLSNTNLSNARVEGALFGDNMGLEPEIKLNLEAKGAIFPASRSQTI